MGSLSLLQWLVLDPGIELGSTALQADSVPTELSREAQIKNKRIFKMPPENLVAKHWE